VGQLTARSRPRYTRQRLSWRDKIHQAAERREQRRLGAALEFGEPVLQAAQIVVFPLELIGEERTDRRTENRPSLPRGHLATRAWGTLCGKAATLSAALATRPVHDAFIRPPGGDIKVRSSARSVSPANSACLEIGRQRFSTCSQATNLRLVLEKALATHRFQYATSKDVCFVFSPASR